MCNHLLRQLRAVFLVFGCLLFAGSAANAFEIRFDYSRDTQGFFADPERRAALEQAAREYTDQLEDHLAELAVPDGVLAEAVAWTAVFPDPQTGKLVAMPRLEVAEDELLVYVGARPLASQGRLAVGGAGQLQLPCWELLAPWSAENQRDCALVEEADATAGRHAGVGMAQHLFQYLTWMFVFRSSFEAREYPPRDFAPWGGSLSFASDADWHFGSSVDVPADRFDFYSVAVHELGHVLGIGTAESWGVQVPHQEFLGQRVHAVHGGSVPLDSDLAHWKNDTWSRANGVHQRAAYSEGLQPGERRDLTELDLAALQDIGWELKAGDVPRYWPSPYLRWIKGDLNGDGQVDNGDVELLDQALQGSTELEEMAFDAADVAPMQQGNAVGDGLLDERDLELLLRVAAGEDVDADGLPSDIENRLNATWMSWVGRPRFGPLTRWSEDCLIHKARLGAAWGWAEVYTNPSAALSLEFCGRDGSPWNLAPSTSPETYQAHRTSAHEVSAPAESKRSTGRPRHEASESAIPEESIPPGRSRVTESSTDFAGVPLQVVPPSHGRVFADGEPHPFAPPEPWLAERSDGLPLDLVPDAAEQPSADPVREQVEPVSGTPDVAASEDDAQSDTPSTWIERLLAALIRAWNWLAGLLQRLG